MLISEEIEPLIFLDVRSWDISPYTIFPPTSDSFQEAYPLVICYIAMESQSVPWLNPLFLWPCSIAIVSHYQRVNPIKSHSTIIFLWFSTKYLILGTGLVVTNFQPAPVVQPPQPSNTEMWAGQVTESFQKSVPSGYLHRFESRWLRPLPKCAYRWRRPFDF